MVLPGLALARDPGAARLPEQIEQKIQSQPKVRSLCESVRDNLFIQRKAEQLVELQAEKHLFHLRMRERWRDRIPYLSWFFGLLRSQFKPNSRDKELLPLPGKLSFLLYLTRPMQLFRDYGGHGLSYLKRLFRKLQAYWTSTH